MNKKLTLIGLALIALVQWFVPGKMIWDQEQILLHGTEFKFRTAPIDPNDPFRGKFIVLRYQDVTIQVDNPEYWEEHETIYVSIDNDEDGYAIIQSISKTRPDTQEYFEATVRYANQDGEVFINFPFDRYYMEESKAKEAENIHREARNDDLVDSYAVVNVREGKAALKDVRIEGVPIRELVERNQEQKVEE